MSQSIISVDDDRFEHEVNKTEMPVLLDFWADWCAPCKIIEPMLQELADEYAGRLRVIKVNIDQARITAQQYDIRGIPTLMMVREGNELGMKMGAVSKTELKQFIDEHLRA
ncbi:MAG: thioredoxin TrxA [Wenzhouxiangellaceae bacterium]